jgi:transposase
MANATGRPIAPLILSSDERAYLERQVRRHRVARSLSERCRVILRCADGLPSKSVASELGVHEHTVGKWRRRFLTDRIEGLLDEARPGRPRTIGDDQVAAVIERTLRSTPKDATHWSIRSMATQTGFSHTRTPERAIRAASTTVVGQTFLTAIITALANQRGCAWRTVLNGWVRSVASPLRSSLPVACRIKGR